MRKLAQSLRPGSSSALTLSSAVQRHAPWLILGALVALAPLASQAESDAAARYPFDPACKWGRLSNGKGMIHRCLTKKEARDISEAEEKRLRADAEKKAAACAEDDQKCKDKALAGAKEKPAPEPDQAKSLPKSYSVEVGPITADKGTISVGRLHKPIDRYKQCIDQNGGLQKSSATVVVQFLVRSERLRAEGVSVASANGVSKRAAKCIADVVDRRKVGAPSVALTAAKLTFKMKEKK